jgi:uncharacterized protein
LIGRRSLPPGAGLLIPRCASVHTAGMRFAIDVVFVRWRRPAPEAEVLAVREALRPWRSARARPRQFGIRRREVAVVEMAAGEARRLGLAPGAALSVTAAESAARTARLVAERRPRRALG